VPDEGTHVPVPHGKIAVRRSGNGPPVVFVHGAGGDGHNWDGVVERLHDRFDCVVIDRAGYGASSWDAPEPPDREAHGKHLELVLGALGLTDPCAVGTSGGALTILAGLRRLPTLLLGAVLIEPPLRIGDDSGDAAATPGARPSIPAGADLLAAGEASIRRLDAAAWDGMSPENRQRYIASFPAMFRDTSQPTLVLTPAELATMTLPLDVVYGSATPERLAQSSIALAEALPNSTLEVVERAAHLMYLTHTDQVASLIGTFLDACMQSSRSAAQ
jgi:pimeloyl-ACP methyl ester carboxylesterase